MRIIAYTYESDMHCPACTRQRFAAAYSGAWHPRDEHNLPNYAPQDASAVRDNDDNPIHPVFSTDEHSFTHCGDCREEL